MAQGLRFVLFGPPGAGKGTQAQMLKDRLNVTHISSGDIFRHHLGKGTPLGLRAKEYMKKGELVPDDVTIDIILDEVMGVPEGDGFILDGFPRNTNQAQELEKVLAAESRGLDKVVHIDVSEPELLRRLGGRFICHACPMPSAKARTAAPRDAADAAGSSTSVTTTAPRRSRKGSRSITKRRCLSLASTANGESW